MTIDKICNIICEKGFEIETRRDTPAWIAVVGNVKNLEWECEYILKSLKKRGIDFVESDHANILADYNPFSKECTIHLHNVDDSLLAPEEEEFDDGTQV